MPGRMNWHKLFGGQCGHANQNDKCALSFDPPMPLLETCGKWHLFRVFHCSLLCDASKRLNASSPESPIGPMLRGFRASYKDKAEGHPRWSSG